MTMNIKKSVKNGISNGIFAYNRSFGSKALKKGNSRILMYHAIESPDIRKDKMCLAVPRETFRMHMQYLKENGFRVVGLLELADRITNNSPIPDKTVAITFDDGFKSILTNALPILKEFGFPATLFVNIYFVERKLPENLYWHGWETLSWHEIRSLYGAGMSIGSHGVTHRRLAGLNEKELKNEIADSRELIEKNINSRIYAFCYPHGAFNNKVKKVLSDNGFRYACSGIEGINNAHSDIFMLKRTEITAFDDMPIKFEKKLLGCYDWLGYIGVHR
jgi:peptidoglycan/xylan/chitin deacetylase (PgdA/CDA1 family)